MSGKRIMCCYSHFWSSLFRHFRIVLMLCGMVCCLLPEVRGQDFCAGGSIGPFTVDNGQCYAFTSLPDISYKGVKNVVRYELEGMIEGMYDETEEMGDGDDAGKSQFKIGTTYVTYFDENGEPACSFYVIVVAEPLTIDCTSPVVYPNENGYFPANNPLCIYTGSFPAPSVTGNCTPVDISYTITNNEETVGSGSGDIINFPFPMGINTVIYTITDQSGNTATCDYIVVVKDDQVPEAICTGTDDDPVTIELEPETGTKSIFYADIYNGSIYNCTAPKELDFSLNKDFFTCSDLGINTIKLTVWYEDGNTSTCVSKVRVLLPSIEPQVALNEEEICSGDVAELVLNNPGFESLTRWRWEVNVPTGITPNVGLNGSESGDHTISHTFANNYNAVDLVTYTITPTIRYNSFNQCRFPSTDLLLWVNPHPQLHDLVDVTICNETGTLIPVGTGSKVSKNAAVYYRWEVPANSLGAADSDKEYDVNVLPSITQMLVNQSYSDQSVDYSLFPSLHLNDRICWSPHEKTITVTVMPTPDFQVTGYKETICNGNSIEFEVNSQNDLHGKGTWLSDLNINAESGSSVIAPYAPLSQNSTFSQTITNNTRSGRVVSYTFTPQIEIPGKICYAFENGKIFTATVPIHVNPVPVMEIESFRDRICHRDDGPEIRITSTNGDIFGDLRFNLDVEITDVENVAPSDNLDFTRRPDFTTWEASIDQTGLWNKTNTLQTVSYHFYPFIEYNGTLRCEGRAGEITIHLAPEVTFDITPSQATYGTHHLKCYGDSDAEIKIENVNGGWPANGYDYEWRENTGNHTAMITGLSAGNYGITVIDRQIGCKRFEEITLTQPELLRLLPPSITQPDCRYSDGTIIINATGGTRSEIYPYKYKWSAAGIFNYLGENSSFTDLKAATYTITVIDTNQCKVTTTIDLPYRTDTDFLDIGNWRASNYGPDQNNHSYNITCYGANDGYLNPNTSGKVASAYTWKYNGELFKKDSIEQGGRYFTSVADYYDFRITDLAPGVYELTIIDNSGCELISNPVTVTEPPPITYNESVPRFENNFEVKCYGDKNGSIIITDVAGAFGGTFTYLWNKSDGDLSDIVQGASQQTSLGAGTYELSIINQYDCKTTVTYTLAEPSELIVNETIQNHNDFEIQCYGGNTGSIILDVSGGGSGGYVFQWNTSDGSGLAPLNQNQNGLTAGTYKVDIIYSGGLCIKKEEYMLRSPSRMQNDSIVTDIRCFGYKDASIQIDITGGVPSYTYLWSSSDGIIIDPAAQNQTNLASGVYRLKITDANNCDKLETYTLTEPDPVNPNLEAENMSCDPGDGGKIMNDGYIIAYPSGGTPGFSYIWDNGLTTDKITELEEGTYSVTVTDVNGCEGTASAHIGIPLPLTVKAVAVSEYNGYDIDCYGHNTGKIALDIQNGREGYIYKWSSGDITERIENASAGIYSVTVTDRFNCAGKASIILIQPDPLWGNTIITDVACPGDNSGSIQALAGGGVTPFSYQWSNDADTPLAENLPEGNYLLTVTDSNNCDLILEATVTEPPEFSVNFTFSDAFCPDTNDGAIMSEVSGGTPPYAYQWQDVTWGTSPGIADLRSGLYSLEVTDANNCTYHQSVELGYTSAECLRIPNAFSPNDDGSNDRWEISVGDPNSAFRYPLRDVYPEAIVEVYSGNWGMLLYRSQRGYPEPWDGKFQGKYLPVNSYVYRIILNSRTRPITGNVTIIR